MDSLFSKCFPAHNDFISLPFTVRNGVYKLLVAFILTLCIVLIVQMWSGIILILAISFICTILMFAFHTVSLSV